MALRGSETSAESSERSRGWRRIHLSGQGSSRRRHSYARRREAADNDGSHQDRTSNFKVQKEPVRQLAGAPVHTGERRAGDRGGISNGKSAAKVVAYRDDGGCDFRGAEGRLAELK